MKDSLLVINLIIFIKLGCTFLAKIQVLTTVLYCQQHKEHANLELDSLKFKTLIETNPQLEGFFDFMTNLIVPKECSAYNINEAKKSSVGLCYLIAGLRNKFVNQHKLEVGLYLMASGATWEAIDTMSSLGYSTCAKTVNDFRKKAKNEYISKVKKHFMENNNVFHVYNVDDYHAIHKIRRPDTVSTSSAKHFVTCVAKPVIDSPSVPLIVNHISIHNPSNPYWVSQKQSNEFDRVEALTVHMYNDNIIERKEERSMKGLQLVRFNEQKKGNDTFTLEDLVDSDDDAAADNNDVEEEANNGFQEIDESLEILSKLTTEINQINLW
ncbi:hypothetical protein C2G38_2254302 [Gigaspora rosea]|uniref:Uncharacterized protein n=1 Tax=Gigaspora rosea TaxID=44941 RepID=A0A397U680_9GLOM|nr:hypothetical protein C2G38_2254302 [Gigaspora rosea]